MLHIEEEVEEEKEDPMSQSDSSSLLAEAEAVSRIVTVQLERVLTIFYSICGFANSYLD